MSDNPGGTVGVQTGELGQLASKLRVSGENVARQSEKVTEGVFGPGETGANYVDQGKKIQQGLESVVHWLQNWAEATIATADGVGASVVAYSDTDRETAGDIGKAAP
ncbi:hypothetical protein [Nocardia callitridis]|uniref:Excreted virulence factor EspC (Type VII ESX diderm) n=1 Tax=Nocardia callitridis TaxID=648753 RepID=A0ABP9L035_9NOCA